MTNLDLDAAETWISTLYGDVPGLVHLCAFGDWEGRSFDWATESEQALAYIASRDNTQGIYLRVTTLRGPLEPGKRGSDDDSLNFPGLWADIDLAGPGHKTTHQLPATFEDAQLILQRVQLPEPTVWVHSGGGLYPLWLIPGGHRITSREDFEQLRALSAKWQEVIGYGAQTAGLHYGTGVGDLSRVLRLPGTVNRKEGLQRPCRVLEDTWGRSYTLDELKESLALAVQALPEPAPAPQTPLRPRATTAPGDDFENQTTWAQILEPAGATWHHRTGHTDYWTRPGKPRRDGYSATTGRDPTRDRLFVMSTDWDPFPAWEPITKFHAYSLLHHGGDHRAAARELAAQGYGDQATRFQPPDYDRWESTLDSPKTEPTPQLSRTPRGRQDYTISGAANRFVREQGHFFWYVTEEKAWRVWDGVCWRRDEIGARLSQAFEAMTEDMMDEAEALMREATGDPDKLPMAKAYAKHVNTIRNANRTNILNIIATHRLISASEFDADPRYLNLQNGVYDMVVDQFLPHDPKYLLTKVAGVTYDPAAQAPRSQAFFEELLPSQQMREFVLQGLGYSLTGEADRKAMFVLQGQSNSGKTQLNELAQGVFGDYAVPISPGAFMKKQDQGPNPELHDARGARFVYTSETGHDLQLDEDLVKRITGKDTMKTRTLYEKLQQWIPQCVVWIATNNLPRFSSDGEAMWRRVKTVRFVNEFTDDGSSGHQAQPNIGRNLARDEGAGLFNMFLAALRRYRIAGRLVEPEELKESVAEHRRETDPVSQWVAIVQEQGHLKATPGGRANFKTLRKAYTAWCVDEGFQPLAAQRFGAALAQVMGYTKQRSNGETWVVGWDWSGANWIVGMTDSWGKRE